MKPAERGFSRFDLATHRFGREERRAQIVDGLMRVLPEHGYERASVARIAKAAGLSPGLVHHHFENKQAILLALGERLDVSRIELFNYNEDSLTSHGAKLLNVYLHPDGAVPTEGSEPSSIPFVPHASRWNRSAVCTEPSSGISS